MTNVDVALSDLGEITDSSNVRNFVIAILRIPGLKSGADRNRDQCAG
jgi:hypothetical protein